MNQQIGRINDTIKIILYLRPKLLDVWQFYYQHYFHFHKQFVQMFGQHQFNHTQEHSHNGKSSETPRERIQRIKKTKNIRKEKIQQQRTGLSFISRQEDSEKDKLSREQKAQIQKSKNRIAAQQSRDKQKKYLLDLQQKIQDLETQLSQQLCSKCKTHISQESSTNQHEEERFSYNSINILPEQQISNNRLLEQPNLQFYRHQSSDSVNSISRFLFICMIAIAVLSFSASINLSEGNQISGNRILQAISSSQTKQLDTPYKSLNDQFSTSLCSTTTLKSNLIANVQNWNQEVKFTENHCKYEYIQNYFLEEEQLQSTDHQSTYNNNRLLNCGRPQLIMDKKKENGSGSSSFFSGLFTIILDNPQIMEVSNSKGVIQLDNIVSLRGLYQIEVKFMNIKKIIGQSCLN